MNADPRILPAILRQDLYSFVQATFPIVSPHGAFKPNWHIDAMAVMLTKIMSGEINRLIIMVPPRNLKSICTSVAFPAFVLGHDPRRRFVCVSYSESLARKHANDTRAIMRSKLYSRIFPNTRISPDKDTELEFATTAGGGRLATSIGGTLTGRGGNIIVIDDPIKPQDAHSELERENVKQWYSNTLITRLDNKLTDAIIIVMQRLHVDDLAGYLIEQDGWNFLNLPAIAQYRHVVELSAGHLKVREEGEVLHSEREPLSKLEEIKSAMGSMDFAAQYQQDPVAAEGNYIKWKWFNVYDVPPQPKSGDKIVVSWDTASSGKDLSSYSACVVLHVRGEIVSILDVIRKRMEYPDLRRAVLDVHRRWRGYANNYALLIENKGSGMALIQELRKDGIRAIAINPDSDKLTRMAAQSARIESGAVSIPRTAPWLEEFRKELLAFPAGRYNDQTDALSQALQRAFTRRASGSVMAEGLW